MTDIALIRQELENSVREYCSKQEIPKLAISRVGHAGFIHILLIEKIDELQVSNKLLDEVKSMMTEIEQRFIRTTDFD